MGACSKCGGETKFMEGTSKKSGKPYKGYKCLDRNCDNMDFIKDDPKPAPKPVAKPQPIAPNGGDSKVETMIMAYAKDLIVAQINQGTAPEHPAKSIIFTFRLLLNECRNPGSTVFKDEE